MDLNATPGDQSTHHGAAKPSIGRHTLVMSDVAVSVHVVGQVQGVGFRWSCREEAERLGVRGWVRNEPDESVAAQFEGDRDAVDRLVEWCRSGSSWAHVERMDVDDVEPSGASGFEIRT